MEEFFKDIIEITPQVYNNAGMWCIDGNIADKQTTERLKGTINSEISRLIFYLMDKPLNDRVTILEWVTKDLLTGYYDTRFAMRKMNRETSEKLRGIMLLFENVLLRVILLADTLKIKYSDAFIQNWERRTNYFPYGDMMRKGIQSQDTGQCLDIPKELNTHRAKKYFNKAIEAGIIAKTDTGYEKMKITKAQLAYFLELVFCRDDAGKDNHKDFPEKRLSILFGESRLGRARGQCADNKKNNGKPKGYETIEKIFE